MSRWWWCPFYEILERRHCSFETLQRRRCGPAQNHWRTSYLGPRALHTCSDSSFHNSRCAATRFGFCWITMKSGGSSVGKVAGTARDKESRYMLQKFASDLTKSRQCPHDNKETRNQKRLELSKSWACKKCRYSFFICIPVFDELGTSLCCWLHSFSCIPAGIAM